MAGCDYLKSLPGIGIKKAHQQLSRTKNFVRVSFAAVYLRKSTKSCLLTYGTLRNPTKVYVYKLQACRAFRLCGISVPDDYEVQFQKALWIFRHQRVFCRSKGRLVHLTPIPLAGLDSSNIDVPTSIPLIEEDKYLSFLGPAISHEDVRQIALGDFFCLALYVCPILHDAHNSDL